MVVILSQFCDLYYDDSKATTDQGTSYFQDFQAL